MPKQDNRYSYDTIEIFKKLNDNYASSNINFGKNQKYYQNFLF